MLALYSKSSLALFALVAVRGVCHSCGGRDLAGCLNSHMYDLHLRLELWISVIHVTEK